MREKDFQQREQCLQRACSEKNQDPLEPHSVLNTLQPGFLLHPVTISVLAFVGHKIVWSIFYLYHTGFTHHPSGTLFPLTSSAQDSHALPPTAPLQALLPLLKL